MPTRFAFLDQDEPIAFAHRGGAGDWPENTMPAFEGAVALGYRYLETDVHVTRDGVLLAFHDDVLDRVTDRNGLIRDLDWADVSQAKVDGREPIPRFDELLDAWPDIRINIDPKHESAVEPLAASIRRAGAVDRVCIGSFSDRRIATLRNLLGPDLCTSLGPKGVARLRAASYGLRAKRFPAPCVQIPPGHGARALLDGRLMQTARAHGIDVHVWTIDEPAEMHRLLDLGVDGIMTDRPAILREVLESRGVWVGREDAPG